MTKMQLYTRLVTELHPMKHRFSGNIRVALQDVLIELRTLAAKERGDETGQETQDLAESIATQEANHV